MGSGLWMQGAVFGLVLTQLIVFWVLYRRSELFGLANDNRAGANGSGSSASDTDDHVICPDCGSENGPAFRYCQNCVTELPGTTRSPETTGALQGRGSS